MTDGCDVSHSLCCSYTICSAPHLFQSRLSLEVSLSPPLLSATRSGSQATDRLTSCHYLSCFNRQLAVHHEYGPCATPPPLATTVETHTCPDHSSTVHQTHAINPARTHTLHSHHANNPPSPPTATRGAASTSAVHRALRCSTCPGRLARPDDTDTRAPASALAFSRASTADEGAEADGTPRSE